MNALVLKFPLIALTAAFLAVPALNAQTTVTTDPVGYNTFNLQNGSNMRVNTFVQAKAFQGVAASITSASNCVITVSGTGAVLTADAYDETASQPIYYLEVLGSGSGQGLIADVISNTANTITVAANIPSFGVSGTTSFCIRPHTTLSSLFPATTASLTGFVDSIKLFFPNNTSKLYLFTGSGSGWVDANTFTDAGSQVVYPGQGFIMVVASTKTVSVMGSVKAGPTIVPLYAGAVNIVGSINPMVSGSQTLSSYNLPSAFAPFVDQVKLFNDNGTLTSQGLYLSNGSNMIDSSTFVNSDSVSLQAPNAVIVTVAQSKNWIMPSFYTSGQ